jgi:hypothetical protein
MFIDETGSIITFDSSNLQINLNENWIILPGCEFNPMDRTTEELVNFEDSKFSATFKNIVNPASDAVSAFTIQVYKKFDDDTLELS